MKWQIWGMHEIWIGVYEIWIGIHKILIGIYEIRIGSESSESVGCSEVNAWGKYQKKEQYQIYHRFISNILSRLSKLGKNDMKLCFWIISHSISLQNTYSTCAVSLVFSMTVLHCGFEECEYNQSSQWLLSPVHR